MSCRSSPYDRSERASALGIWRRVDGLRATARPQHWGEMALFQLLLSARLALFRRILTPTVAGTVIMLIPVTVMPYVFGMLEDVPEGSPALAAPLSALTTVLVICTISLKAAGTLRLWAPVIGVVAGSLVDGVFGLLRPGSGRRGSLGRLSAGCLAGLRSRLRAGVLGAGSRVPAGHDDRHGPDHQQLRRRAECVVAPAPGPGFPRGAGIGERGGNQQRDVRRGGDGAEHVVFGRRIADRAHRDRSPRDGRRGGDGLRRPGAPSEGARGSPGDSRPGRRRLSHRVDGHAVPDRDEDRHPGRARLPQGTDRGLRVLGRDRLPVRPDLLRIRVGARRWTVAKRDDGRGALWQLS